MTLKITARRGKWAQHVLRVLIILGFFAGWILAIGGVHDLSQLHAARSWPARPAIITHFYVRQVRGSWNRRHWHAEIAGKYLDDGSAFNVSRHAYGNQKRDELQDPRQRGLPVTRHSSLVTAARYPLP